jgi:hypothetical protein
VPDFKKPITVNGDPVGGGGGGYTDVIRTGSSAATISSLLGSADVDGRAGAGVSYEFNSGSSPMSWSLAPTTEDVNSTVPSCLYIKTTDSSEHWGSIGYTPAGAFDLRAKVHVGAPDDGFSTPSYYFFVSSTGRSQRIIVGYQQQSGRGNAQFTTYTWNGGSYDQKRFDQVGLWSLVYYRLVGDGSGNFVSYFSSDGVLWWRWASFSYTITIQQMGIWLQNSPGEAAVDWIRSDV